MSWWLNHQLKTDMSEFSRAVDTIDHETNLPKINHAIQSTEDALFWALRSSNDRLVVDAYLRRILEKANVSLENQLQWWDRLYNDLDDEITNNNAVINDLDMAIGAYWATKHEIVAKKEDQKEKRKLQNENTKKINQKNTLWPVGDAGTILNKINFTNESIKKLYDAVKTLDTNHWLISKNILPANWVDQNITYGWGGVNWYWYSGGHNLFEVAPPPAIRTKSYTMLDGHGHPIHGDELQDVPTADGKKVNIKGISIDNATWDIMFKDNYSIKDAHTNQKIDTYPLKLNLNIWYSLDGKTKFFDVSPDKDINISNIKTLSVTVAEPAPELEDSIGGTVHNVAGLLSRNPVFIGNRWPHKRWFGWRILNHLFAKNGKSRKETYEIATNNYMTFLVGKNKIIKWLQVPNESGKDTIDVDMHCEKYGMITGHVSVNDIKHPIQWKTIADLIHGILYHHDIWSEKVRIYSSYNIFKALYKMGIDQFGEMRYPDPNPPRVLPAYISVLPGRVGVGGNFRCELIMSMDKDGNFVLKRRYINNLNFASYDEKTSQELNFKKNNKIDAEFKNGMRTFAAHLHNIFESTNTRFIDWLTDRNNRRYNTKGSVLLRPVRRTRNKLKSLRNSNNKNNRNFVFDFGAEWVKGKFDKWTITIEYEKEIRSGGETKKVQNTISGKNIENIINSTALYGKQIPLMQDFYEKMIKSLYTNDNIYGNNGKQYGAYDPHTNRYYTVNAQWEMGYFVPQPWNPNPIQWWWTEWLVNPNSIPIWWYVKLDNSSDQYSTKIMTSKIDIMQKIISCMIDELSLPGGTIARRVRNGLRRLLR
jgi:hypothetical protein